jgi:hypothetical protein
MHKGTIYYSFITPRGRLVLSLNPTPVVRPPHRQEAIMPLPKHAATALSPNVPSMRTLVRIARAVIVALLVVATAGAVLPTRADAVPISDRHATWIAVSAREIALELRHTRNLPPREQRFVAERKIADVAELVASLLDADPQQLRTVWSGASHTRKIALFSALSQVGVPYRTNADAPFIALDCSALTRFAWAQAGVAIERGSAYQYAHATRLSRDNVQVGDFVWYPGHIMFSLGVPELIVHARSGDRSVEIHRIDSTRLSGMRWASPISR